MRTMKCVPVDIECGCPLLTLIDAHDKCKGLRILVDIHFFEAHAIFLQELPGCVGVFAAYSHVHSNMFRFHRSTSFRWNSAGSPVPGPLESKRRSVASDPDRLCSRVRSEAVGFQYPRNYG